MGSAQSLTEMLKVKVCRNRLSVAQRVPGDLGTQISRHSSREVGEVVSLTHRPSLPPPQEMFLVLIFTLTEMSTRNII